MLSNQRLLQSVPAFQGIRFEFPGGFRYPARQQKRNIVIQTENLSLQAFKILLVRLCSREGIRSWSQTSSFLLHSGLLDDHAC